MFYCLYLKNLKGGVICQTTNILLIITIYYYYYQAIKINTYVLWVAALVRLATRGRRQEWDTEKPTLNTF